MFSIKQVNMAKSENIFSVNKLPAINTRIKELIDYYAGGSVKLFSEKVNLASSQKLNRIFNIDKRNGEYPDVSSDILIAIANMYSDVDINWILTGNGDMFRNKTCLTSSKISSDSTTLQLVNTISNQAETIGSLKKEIEQLRDKIQRLENDVSSKEEDVKNASTKKRSSIDNTGATSAGVLLK